jgi:hypothetical protein
LFTARYELNVYRPIEVKFRIGAVPGFKQLVGGLSPRRRGFDARSVDAKFEVDKVTLGQVFLRVLRIPSVSVIPPMFHTHLRIHVVLTRRTKGRSLGSFQNAVLFWKSRSIG